MFSFSCLFSRTDKLPCMSNILKSKILEALGLRTSRCSLYYSWIFGMYVCMSKTQQNKNCSCFRVRVVFWKQRWRSDVLGVCEISFGDALIGPLIRSGAPQERSQENSASDFFGTVRNLVKVCFFCYSNDIWHAFFLHH